MHGWPDPEDCQGSIVHANRVSSQVITCQHSTDDLMYNRTDDVELKIVCVSACLSAYISPAHKDLLQQRCISMHMSHLGLHANFIMRGMILVLHASFDTFLLQKF